MRILRAIKSSVVILYMGFLLACGPSFFTSLKLGITAFGPTAQILVKKGLITQTQADNIRTAADDTVDVAARLNSDLTAATTTAQKLTAWQAASHGWTAIVGRGHFANIPYIDDAAEIIDTIFDTALAFYGDTPPAKGKLGARKPATIKPASEAALADNLKLQVEVMRSRLKAAK